MKKAAATVLVAAWMVSAVLTASVGAQTRDRDLTAEAFMRLGRGAEIGVSVRELTTDEVSRAKLERAGGVFVADVGEASPASRAGLRSGDIIVSFDGERVRSVRHFSRLVMETPPGRTVQAEIVRDGARQTISVTPDAAEGIAGLLPEIRREIERGLRTLPRDLEVDPLPRPGARARLGLSLEPLTGQLASYFGVREGVLVSAVQPESAAAAAGLRAGDVITEINGRAVRLPAEVSAAARTTSRGGRLDVGIVRDKKEMNVEVTIGDVPAAPARQV